MTLKSVPLARNSTITVGANLNAYWFRSSNGGKSFDRAIMPQGGHHAIWINPNNSMFMVPSSAGGASVSINGGRIWRTKGN
jgi:hypothetical protein